MSNLHDLNQQNPFADLLAAFNTGGAQHPFFAAFNPEARDRGAPPPSYQDNHTPTSSDDDSAPPPPPQDPQPPSGGDGLPHRGRHGPHPGPHHHGEHPGPHRGGPHPGHRRGGHCGGRGGWRGGPRHAGGFGPWGGMMGPGGFDLNRLGDFISQFVPEEQRQQGNKSTTEGKDFAPDADIFDTADTYVVHVSLPGAKKEDVGVNWNADQSELNIAGVIYRPGDEEFIKTLAVNERKVGVFERKIKLGTREKPALVEADGIAAKMEDGILVITIPKTEKDFVEVKKVDIE